MKYLGTKTLETKRLILRKIKKDDYKEAYNNWCSSDEVVKYTIHGTHKSEETTKKFYHKWIKEYEDLKYIDRSLNERKPMN